VEVIQPLLTERVVARKEAVPERWRRITIEAAELCGRTSLPALRAPVTLDEAIGVEGAKAFCWESERAQTLWRYLATDPPDALTLFVGPEGGFSEREARLARERGAAVVSLGHLILRAETAAVAATALALLTP
jgi:16S rRNA (uracil1498-N3)-methyltransferase